MTLNELRQRRAALIAQQRARLDSDPEYASETQAAVELMDSDLDRLESQISAMEASERRQATLAVEAGEHVDAAAGAVVDDDPRASAEHAENFWNFVRGQEFDRRILSRPSAIEVGVDSAGGYLVPTTYENRLIADALDYNPIREIATVRVTSAPGKIPTLNTRPVFALIDEKGAFPVTDPVYGQKGYDAYKFGGIILVSDEVMQDSMFDLPSHVADLFGSARGVVEGSYFTTGAGTAQPQGFVVGSTKGIDLASKTAITADELIDLQGSLKAAYDRNARWALKTATWTLVRKLKDATSGQYLLVPGLQAGDTDTLLGKPAHKIEDMAALGSSTKPLVYGDFKHFNILDRTGISIQRLNERYADNGQVGFKCWFRTDSTLEVTEAIKHALCPV